MAPPPDAPLVLEPCPARHGRQLFAHPLTAYESVFGTKLRQLKNWVAIGKELKPSALPPLDQPGEMPAWWVKAYPDRSVPEKIHQAAIKAKHGAPAHGAVVSEKNSTAQTSSQKTPPAATPAATPPPAAPRAKIENFDDVEGMDLSGAVARQKRILAVTMKRLEEATGAELADDALEATLHRRVATSMESLRKLEGTLDELRKSREELIDRATAGEELRRIHTAMATSIETGLVDQLGVDRARARTFVDTLFGLFRTSRFFSNAEPAQPLLAAA